MQHIVVGRFLPEDGAVSGQAVVTGKLNGEDVKYVANVELKTGSGKLDGTEDDNSFIPRLWAKARLDHLLSQSVDDQAKEEIIQLSQEFTLITPYTSLLVLESDADRKRFNVERRVHMLKGERFFQTAEDRAKLEQRQKLLAQAKRYRQGLRMQALASLAQMGRGQFPTFQALQQAQIYDTRLGRSGGVWSSSGAVDRLSDWGMFGAPMSGPVGRMRGGISLGDGQYDELDFAKQLGVDGSSAYWAGEQADFGMPEDAVELAFEMDFDDDVNGVFDPQPRADLIAEKAEPKSKERYVGDHPFGSISDREVYLPYGGGEAAGEYILAAGLQGLGPGGLGGGGFGGRMPAEYSRRLQSYHFTLDQASVSNGAFFAYSDFAPEAKFASYSRRGRGYYYQSSLEQFPEIFPSLSSPSDKPARELPLPATWTPEAVRLADRLVQRDDLGESTRLSIRSRTVSHDPEWERVTGRSASEALIAPANWLVRTAGPASFTHVDLAADGKRRAAWPHRGTGRVRDLAKEEAFPSIDAYGHGIEQPLYRSHGEYEVRVLSDDGETAELEMVWSVWKSRLTMDLQKNVVTRIETYRTDLKNDDGEPQKSSEIRFEDFVSAGGLTLPRKKISLDEQGRVTSETTQTIEALAPDAYDEAFETATDFVDDTLWLSVDLPTFLVAKARENAGETSLEDAWVVFTTEVGRQGWKAAEEALTLVKRLAGEKFALDEIEFHFDRLARHGEKALATATAKVEALIAEEHPDELPRLDIWRDHVASGVSSERWLEIVDSLKPLYERQEMPEYGLLAWMRLRIWALESLGRKQEATELMGERVRAMLWDYSEQTTYARRLQNEGKTEEALAYLRKLLADESLAYDGGERDQFRSVIADFLEQDRRYRELVDFLRDWTEQDDRGESVYARLLWALLAIDRQDEAEELVAKWIDRALQPEELDSGEYAQARTAIRYRLGYVHQISRSGLTVPAARDLLGIATKLLAFPDRWELAMTVYGYGSFDQMEQGAELRERILDTLKAKYRDVTVEQIQVLRNYLRHDGSDELNQFHRDLAEYWEQQRAKLEDQRRDQLTERLWELYGYSPFAWRHRVEFSRKIVAEGGSLRDTFQARLVDLLLDPPTDQLEEMLPAALREIAKLGRDLAPGERKVAQLAKLESAATGLPEKLFAPKRREIERLAEEEPQKRTEHEQRFKEARAAATAKAVAMLKDWQEEAPAFQKPWLDLFAWTLLVGTESERPAIVAGLRRIVGEAPGPEIVGEPEDDDDEANDETDADADAPQGDEAAEEDAEAANARAEAQTDATLRTALVSRAIVMLAALASRPEADAELVAFVRGWLEQTTQAPRASLAWRQFLYQFLLARDDADRIEQILRKWSSAAPRAANDGTADAIDDRDLTAPWKRELAMFLAERSSEKAGDAGKADLAQAVRIFESLDADRTLPAGDLLLLADWKLALGDEEAWKKLRREAWELADEYVLSQVLQQTSYAWQSGNKPETLDEETLRQIDVLFAKSSNPGNYVGYVRDIYLASKDFRLLANLPRQVVGRTSGVAYSFAQNVAEQIVPSVHEETTLNEMRRVIDELYAERKGDDPQSVTDRRLLDLLLMTVEMRAQNVLNQPGPHVEKALAALRRASEKPYREDEAVPAAFFFRSTLNFSSPAPELQRAILAQMARTELAVGQASYERLRIASLRMQAIEASSVDPPVGARGVTRRQQALLIGQAAFDDFRKAHEEEFPPVLQELLAQRMSLLENDRRYRESERLLESVEELARRTEGDDWYDTRLLLLWRLALYFEVEVSVGAGQDLYVALRDAALERVEESSPRQRQDRLNFLADVFQNAFDRKLTGVRDDVNRFVETKLDDAIAEVPEAFDSVIGRYGSLLESVFTMKRRLAFLLDRLEDYPPLLAWDIDHRNRNFGETIASLRVRIDQSKTETLGELEEPTLAFMIEELQREIRWRQSSQRYGWSRNYDQDVAGGRMFWVAKRERFRDAALEVLGETPDSVDATLFVARFLYNDLDLIGDAIVVLEKAWRNGMTTTEVGEQLVSYLRTAGREPEAIPYLLALIERSPGNMQYRKELILAYKNAGRRDEANAAFDAAAKYLDERDQRDEGSLATLGEAGVEVDRAKEGVALVEEAIRIRELNVASVTSGDSQFSDWFRVVSRGYLKMGEGRKAFDAAASAVVVWPPGHDQRRYPIDALRDVLRNMLGREKFVADWNAEVEKTGKDSQLLRKELGRVLLDEGKPVEAAEQLELAVELAGIDVEVDRLLTEAYAKANDADALRQAWIRRVKNSPREYDLYLQFGRTLEKGDPMIERAVTTTVELDPTEGGAHLALAGWRLEQGDLDAAERQYVRAQELRTFDPAGWLGQAEVQIRQEDRDGLKATIEKLRQTGWTNPPGNLSQQIDALEAKLP